MTTEGVEADLQPAILLVDDDSFMLDLQTRMLRDLGFRNVVAAGNGRQALERLAAGGRAPDIIVCDLNMPGMDGIEFLKTMSAHAFEGSVILLSSEGVRIMNTVQKLLSGGRLVVLGALEKPAPSEALRALMQRWKPVATSRLARPEQLPLAPEEVSEAIRADRLLLHYQPKVDLRTGALVGFEALVRIDHPRHGIVFPDRFVDVAERSGSIGRLTRWVLHAAVGQLARWNAEGLAAHVAVNVSMEDLCAPDFASGAARTVRDAGASPTAVTLEVTESRAMSASMAPLETLVRLRLARFRLSIDDFGTGHSSLAQLRDLPFTELKIDRGFVHGAHSNQIIRPMLEGSIGLAKRLGMTAVAEGVETVEDLDLLRDSECDFAQGYLVGRPMAAAALPAWRKEWELRREALFAS
jgi:EAL domain-containing protein (putative c-di-GMP-specific phosphodiesterase class I)/FixJ family two-component response regulator